MFFFKAVLRVGAQAIFPFKRFFQRSWSWSWKTAVDYPRHRNQTLHSPPERREIRVRGQPRADRGAGAGKTGRLKGKTARGEPGKLTTDNKHPKGEGRGLPERKARGATARNNNPTGAMSCSTAHARYARLTGSQRQSCNGKAHEETSISSGTVPALYGPKVAHHS